MEWIVGGFILGPVLPAGDLQLGNAEIRRIREGESFGHFKPTNVRMSMEGTTNYRSVVYGRQEVHSEWIIRFSVEAASQVEAYDEVDQRLLPLVQAALNVAFGDQYFVDLHVIVPANGSQPQVSPFVESGPTRGFEPRTPSDDEIENLRTVFKVLTGDSKGLQAAHLLSTSAAVEDVSNQPRVQRFVLLTLFQAIEQIVNEAAKSAPSDSDLEHKQQTIVSHLTKALAKDQPVGKKVSRIRDGVLELNRLEKVFTGLRIEAAGELIGLNQNTIDSARRLLSLRNTKLGHTGAPVPQDELLKWLAEARETARRFLSAYVEWKRN